MTTDAAVRQFRPAQTRLRIEISGDVAAPAPALDAVGSCAIAGSTSFSGTADVMVGGTSVTGTGGALTFTKLAVPVVAAEPGVILATDAAGDQLMILWQGLAGVVGAPPLVRIQLASFNSALVTRGAALSASFSLTAQAADAAGVVHTTTWNGAASGMLVP